MRRSASRQLIGSSVVVATRMRPAKVRFVLPFMLSSLRAAAQARRSPGYIDGRLRVDAHLAFWTLTVWEDRRSMEAYRNTGYHAQLVPRLRSWAKEGAFVSWTSSNGELLTFDDVAQRLDEQATFAKLDAPTAAQRARRIDEPAPLGLLLPIPRPIAHPPARSAQRCTACIK